MTSLPWEMIGAIFGVLSFILTLIVEWNKLGVWRRSIIAFLIGMSVFGIIIFIPTILPPQPPTSTDTPTSIVTTSSDSSPKIPSSYQILFTSKRNGNDDIYKMNVDGSEIIRLTNNPSKESNPIISPDGNKIVFISDRNGSNDIFTMNPDGSNQQLLLDNPTTDWNPIWSPDGEFIAFVSDFQGNYDVYVVNSDGTNMK